MLISIHENFELNNKSFNCTNDLIAFSGSISSALKSFLIAFLDASETIKLHTSGSTGKPKVIAVKKEFMINSAKATGEFFKIGADTTALLCLDINYVGGKMMLVRALVLGWKLDIVSPSSNPLEGINKNYDFSALVPMQVVGSMPYLNKIKTLIIGGGSVSNELLKSLQNLKTTCYATYGMTETVSHIALKKLNNTSTDEGTSQYKLLPNVTITADERNCLLIDAHHISEKRIVTNDVVEIISDSEFKWLGRYDNIINSGGIKLNPEQIETKIEKVLFDKRFFVSSIPDALLGEKLILVVEDQNDGDEILEKVKSLESLSKYEIPKEVYFITVFAETETKKIQRNKTLDLIFG